MVWYGNGMVRYFYWRIVVMVWYGMVWYGMVWYGCVCVFVVGRCVCLCLCCSVVFFLFKVFFFFSCWLVPFFVCLLWCGVCFLFFVVVLCGVCV